MSSENRLLRAFKESVADTAVAFVINVPLNFILVSAAFEWGFSAFETSVLLTTIFTIMAVTRKTYIRLHFEKRNMLKAKPETGQTDI